MIFSSASLIVSSLIIPQLFKAIIASKVDLLSLFLNLDIIKAPCEKNLSEKALVAGICKYFLAIKDKTRYFVLFCSQNSKGLIC